MLTLPLPDTMRVPGAKPGKAYMVEGDVYNIVQRIRDEVSRSLSVIFRPENSHPFVVMEHCVDGEYRMVSKYKELDATVVEDLQRMLRVPFEDRFKKVAAEIDAYNDQLMKPKFDTPEFERLAWDMQRELHRAGFVHSRSFKSLRPKQVPR